MKNSDHDFDGDRRLRFARIGSSTREVLGELWSMVHPQLPQLLTEFYQHLCSEPHLNEMLGNHIERLKGVQEQHWARLFQGRFDTAYMNGVYTIGAIHNRIGLEPRWFLAAYQFILNYLSRIVIKATRQKPDLLITRLNALNAAVLLDIDLVIAAYLDASERSQIERVTSVSDTLVTELTDGIRKVNDTVIEQSASVAETSATSRQILSNLEGLNALIEEQAANVIESSASVEQMVANIGAVSRTVQSMNGVYSELQAASEDGKNKIGSVVDAIGKVQGESKRLGEANAAIQEIAAQTSLLAMNAAIEAAHAGNAGRGFSVISTEIKSLSEKSARQSREISANIQQISQLIEASSRASATADAAFRKILDHVKSVTQFSEQIGSSLEEQTQGSQQVLEATNEINRITQQVKDNSQEMVGASRMIDEEMDKLLTATEGLRDRAGELLHETGAIKERVLATQGQRRG